jgi:hypothetical protein
VLAVVLALRALLRRCSKLNFCGSFFGRSCRSLVALRSVVVVAAAFLLSFFASWTTESLAGCVRCLRTARIRESKRRERSKQPPRTQMTMIHVADRARELLLEAAAHTVSDELVHGVKIAAHTVHGWQEKLDGTERFSPRKKLVLQVAPTLTKLVASNPAHSATPPSSPAAWLNNRLLRVSRPSHSLSSSLHTHTKLQNGDRRRTTHAASELSGCGRGGHALAVFLFFC